MGCSGGDGEEEGERREKDEKRNDGEVHFLMPEIWALQAEGLEGGLRLRLTSRLTSAVRMKMV